MAEQQDPTPEQIRERCLKIQQEWVGRKQLQVEADDRLRETKTNAVNAALEHTQVAKTESQHK